MIVLGGRSDIVAQWFTKRFINKRSGLFKEVVVGPGEYAAIIRNGRIEKLFTEEQVKGVRTSIFDSIKTWLGGGDDFQMLVVDIRPKVVSVPFQGFSKDRHRVGGAVNITFRISPQNAMNIINMMAGPTVLDNRWWNREEMSTGPVDPSNYEYSGANLKELTVEDVAARFSRDLEANLYTEVISQNDAESFHRNAAAMSQAILAVVDKNQPLWNEFGLGIEERTCSIGLNALEDALRRKSEVELQQMAKDVEFYNIIKDLTRAKDLTVQSERLRSETTLSKELGEVDYRRAMEDKRHELEVLTKRHAWDKYEVDAEGGERIKDSAQHRELERLKEAKAAEVYRNSLDMELMKKNREIEIELQIKAGNAELDLEQKEMKGLLEIQRQLSDQNIREYQATVQEDKKMAKEIEMARVQKEKEVGVAEAAAKAKAAEAQAAGIDTYERALKGQREHEARLAETDVKKIEQMSKISKAAETTGRSSEQRSCPHCQKVAPSSAIFCPECGRHM